MEIFEYSNIQLYLLTFVILIITYYVYMTWNSNVFKKMGIPVPAGAVPILGHLPLYQKQGVYKLDVDWNRKYGNVYGTMSGTFPLLVITDEDMLRQILVKDFDRFPDRRRLKGLHGVMEESLLFLQGQKWKSARAVLTPTFSASKLKNMMPILQRTSRRLISNLKLKLNDTDNADVKRVFGGYTIDTIASIAFGIEVDSQSNPDDPVVSQAMDMFKVNKFAVLLLTFFPFSLPILGKLGMTLVPKPCDQFFRKFVLQIIKERKMDQKDYGDFLQLLLNAERKHQTEDSKRNPSIEGLTKEEMISQSVMFIIAGYETTATTLTMLVYNLALHPEIQQKLFEEVKEKLGSEVPSYENVQELVYAEMCINETLRLFPPTIRFDRVCVKDTVVKGMKIPKDMAVAVSVYGIHHSPEIWKDPDVFIPERFSPEEKAKINPLHFLPFGYGPRNCIGIRLAYLEMQVAIADFIRNFKVSVCQKTKIPPNFQRVSIMAPEDMWLKVELRE